jgi:hypothetical protein
VVGIGSGQEGYARLPEDLLRDLLDGTGDVVSTVTALLGPALEGKAEIRQALVDSGQLLRFTPSATLTVAGVDGGFAVERTAAVDLALSVAVGVEGLADGTTLWDSPQYQWWALPAKHDMDVERLARGVMVAEELSVLAGAPHQLKILDGSHLTLVIQLNTALTALSVDCRAEAKRMWEKLSTPPSLHKVCRDEATIAMPKYDSSRVVIDSLEPVIGKSIPGDDKYILGLALEPGELLVPRQVPQDPWALLHFDIRDDDDKTVADALEEAIKPLKGREIDFTYFRPTEFSPAFRIELKHGVPSAFMDRVCSTIAGQITGPFVREPYPQYLADVMAKSVGLGLSALQAAVQLALSGLGRPEIAELLIRSYRTEGV